MVSTLRSLCKFVICLKVILKIGISGETVAIDESLIFLNKYNRGKFLQIKFGWNCSGIYRNDFLEVDKEKS